MKYLLIGIGPGNGLALARRFGQGGFHILMVARNADKLRQYEAELAAEGIRSQGYAADIADTSAFQQTLRDILTEHPDVDAMHYNASVLHPALPSQIQPDVFLEDLKTNVLGALVAAQSVLPQMKERQRGALFFTGGGSALQPAPIMAGLGAGKAAMRNLVQSLAQECRPLGIHVATVTICGMVQPGTQHAPELVAEAFWRLYEQPADEWESEVIF
jgi:NAD(P)-dependent dehydrogenase (short-subunit alcohol dehydrogenase family)